MVPPQLVRRYARNQQIDPEVADQEIVLHYALNLLNEAKLLGRLVDGSNGPLLFKGGTALRKCWFGGGGRFSQDIDLDAPDRSGFEATVEEAFVNTGPYHGIAFRFQDTRWSQDEDENFSGTVGYSHEHGEGAFELQISYRLQPVLDACALPLLTQEYFSRVEFPPPILYGLDPHEMIGEKIVACNRRLGGSAKDIYDLFLWARRPFSDELVRRIAVLKAWTDRRSSPRYEPERLLASLRQENFRWEDLKGLVPRRLEHDRERICTAVRHRFAFLATCSAEELALLADQASHREVALYEKLRAEALKLARDAG